MNHAVAPLTTSACLVHIANSNLCIAAKLRESTPSLLI
jgi:hypothetical protein